MTVDAKYRITITDAATGEPVSADGLCGRIETRFALVCALASSGDEGYSFVTAIAGRDITLEELRHMVLAFLQNLERAGRQVSGDPAVFEHFIAAITSSFQQWLTDALGKSGAALMLAGMSMLASGMDPVPEEGEP